jgi:3-dehydroquinate synthase class II
MVAAAGGGTRSALVGRVKIECRPLLLVEAELPDGERCSVLLQNAETVRLVGPAAAGSSSSNGNSIQQAQGGAAGGATLAAESGYVWQQGGGGSGSSGGSGGSVEARAAGLGQSWRAVSVSELAPGHQLFVLRQGGARHTGVVIEESITER